MALITPALESAATGQESSAGSVPLPVAATVIEASAKAPVMLPDGRFAGDAAYRQQGDDLVLTAPDGRTVVVEGYFRLDPPPDLLTPEGGRLTPAMVDSFTPPESAGQYAQAGQLVQGAEPIGQVSDLTGRVFAVRADGTRVRLSAGDAVFQGDVIETAAGGAVNMIFVDDTTFALGADARLALDEMVYNPATQAGSSSFSVLKGVFVFVSGQIAQTDNTQMTVTTPVATIGIRGTKVAGDVRPAGQESRFTVIDGEIAISTQGGTVVMSQANATTVITNFLVPPTPPVVYTTDQLNSAYNSVRSVSNYTSRSNNSGQNNTPGEDGEEPSDESPEKSGEDGGEGGGEDGGEGEGDAPVEVAVVVPEPAAPPAEVPLVPVLPPIVLPIVIPAPPPPPPPPPPSPPPPEPESNPVFNFSASSTPVTFAGGAGNDIIIGSNFGDVLNGGAGNDVLTGGDGNDVVSGGAGNDILVAGSGGGNDSYNGGANFDTLVYTSTTLGITATFSGNAGAGTVTGAEIDSDSFQNIEAIIGGSGADSFVVGSVGGMFFNGGAGNDSLSYAPVTSALTVNLGAGTVSSGTLSGLVTDTFSAFEAFTGGSGDDAIRGSGGNNFINGGGGNDTIFGSGGNDQIDGGSGFNTLIYDTISGVQIDFEAGTVSGAGFIDTFANINSAFVTSGVVNVIGSSNGENFGGGAGNDTILGGGGGDTLSGNAGNDFLDGGEGVDDVSGGAGNDTVIFDGQDFMEGGLGNDTLVVEGSGKSIDFGDTFTFDQETFEPNMAGFEAIDLAGSGSHTLFVEASDILERSDTGTLMLTGDSSNSIVSNTAWEDGGTVNINETIFQILTFDDATFLTEAPFTGNGAVNFTNALDNGIWAGTGNWQRFGEGNDGPPAASESAALFSGSAITYDSSAGTTALAGISGSDDLIIIGGQLTIDEASTYAGDVAASFGAFGGDGAFNITGNLNLSGGEGGPTLFGAGGINALGTLSVGAFTTVELDTTLTYHESATISGTGAVVGTGLLVGASGSTLNLSSAFLNVDFDNDGIVNVAPDAVVNFDGDLANTGTFLINTGGEVGTVFDFGLTGTFTNNGLINISNSAGLEIRGGIFSQDSGTVLFNNSSFLFDNSTLVVNAGEITGSGGLLGFTDSSFILNTFFDVDPGISVSLAGETELTGTGALILLAGADLSAAGSATIATDLTNAGVMQIETGATLDIGDIGAAPHVFQNFGTLVVNGDLKLIDTAATLAAGASLQIASGSRIDLIEETDFALDTDFTLLEGRTIGLGAGAGPAALTGTGTLTNQGNIVFSGGILGIDTVNTGNITTTDGTYTVDGTLTLNNSGEIDLFGGKILAGAGTYLSLGAVILDGDTIAASFVQDAGNLAINGDNTVDGVLQLGAGASISYNANVLDGAGTLVNQNDFDIFSDDIDVTHVVNQGRLGFGDVTLTGSEIINTATGTLETGLDGGGAIDMEAGETTTNAGLIDILSFSNFDFLNGVLENSGVINIGAGGELAILGGTLSMLDGGVLTGAGSVTLAGELNIGAGVNVLLGSGPSLEISGGTITGPGTLTNQANISFTEGAGLDLEFTNSGIMTLGGTVTNVFNIVGASENLAGGTISNNFTALFDMGGAGVFTNNGLFVLNGEFDVIAQEGEFLNDTNGTLSGSGSIVVGANGTFTDNGLVVPGASPGEITIVGNVTRGDSSQMITELAGLAAATEFDVYNVTGVMDLAGTMTVQQIDDFAVDIGDSFAVVNAGQLNGSFHEINGLDVGGGIVIDARQSSTGITLTGIAVTHQGDSGDNTLTGGSGDDVFSAGDGNDIIVSNGGNDLMHGGDGDDVFIVQDTGFGRVDGGNGFDLVIFDGAGESFDLAALRGDRFSSIEALDLTGSGDNALLLDSRIAFAATSGTNAQTGTSHSLIVDGDTGDSVTFEDNWNNTGSVTIGGNGYSVYQSISHDAQVFVDDSVTINAAAA